MKHIVESVEEMYHAREPTGEVIIDEVVNTLRCTNTHRSEDIALLLDVDQRELWHSVHMLTGLRLNDIILKYDINAPTTLAVLAQLSAGYVHQMKQGQEPAYQDHIEDVFQNMYQESLAQFDLHNINREMEKMRQKELN